MYIRGKGSIGKGISHNSPQFPAILPSNCYRLSESSRDVGLDSWPKLAMDNKTKRQALFA